MQRRSVIASLLVVFLGLVAIVLVAVERREGGHFVGDVVLSDNSTEIESRCIGNDYETGEAQFVTQQSFSFFDPEGFEWSVPEGSCVNGASIPKPFWSVIGGPWSGKYRRASVVHDYHTAKRINPWDRVHRAFYDAMVASGVPDEKAKIMYAAVYAFGARWEEEKFVLGPSPVAARGVFLECGNTQWLPESKSVSNTCDRDGSEKTRSGVTVSGIDVSEGDFANVQAVPNISDLSLAEIRDAADALRKQAVVESRLTETYLLQDGSDRD